MPSPVLFLILVDYVVRIANEGSRGGHTVGNFFRSRGISAWPWLRRWSLDDLAQVFAQIRDKTDKVWKAASRVGLEINVLKTKDICINTTLDTPLTVSGETLKCVDSFTYLGSVISKDGSAQKQT